MGPEETAAIVKAIDGVAAIIWWVALWGFIRIFSS